MLDELKKKGKKDNSLDGRLAAAKAKLEKLHKKKYITQLDEYEYDVEKVATRIDALNRATGGGMPSGRMIQLQGAESSGKSSLLYELASLYDKSLIIDLERVIEPNRPQELFGCDPKKILIAKDVESAEETIDILKEYVRAGIPFVGIDSIPYMIPKANQDDSKDVGFQKVGELARILSIELPKIRNIQEETGTTICFVNQLRDDINSFGFGENEHAPGGRQLRHSCCLILKIKRGSQEKMTILGEEEIIGQVMKVKVEKSRVCPPRKTASFYLFYKTGFCDMDGRDEARKESARIYREEKKSESNVEFDEETGEVIE